MSRAGHNRGPDMGRGTSWRKHCWARARADLLPNLPIEILRGRVKRARELGLEYKTYASVRAASGDDVIGFLFSSNALRAFRNSPELPAERIQKLATLQNCKRIALITAPLDPAAFAAANPTVAITPAPAPDADANWPDTRAAITACLSPDDLPRDGVLLIGDTTLEREWSVAGRLAGYLPAERYFAPSP